MGPPDARRQCTGFRPYGIPYSRNSFKTERHSVHTEQYTGFRSYGTIHGIPFIRNNTRDSVHTEQYTGFRSYGTIHGIPFIRSNTRDSVHTEQYTGFRSYGTPCIIGISRAPSAPGMASITVNTEFRASPELRDGDNSWEAQKTSLHSKRHSPPRRHSRRGGRRQSTTSVPNGVAGCAPMIHGSPFIHGIPFIHGMAILHGTAQ
jgi:hypothetical protein